MTPSRKAFMKTLLAAPLLIFFLMVVWTGKWAYREALSLLVWIDS